jgi:hypothetical protein
MPWSKASTPRCRASKGQPGFYCQINIGDYPRPAVIHAEPVCVQRPAKVIVVQPAYLRVPGRDAGSNTIAS